MANKSGFRIALQLVNHYPTTPHLRATRATGKQGVSIRPILMPSLYNYLASDDLEVTLRAIFLGMSFSTNQIFLLINSLNLNCPLQLPMVEQ